jgi:hypothetical protein
MNNDEEQQRKDRAASLRRQIDELRRGVVQSPESPREFVDRPTPRDHPDDDVETEAAPPDP